MLLEQVKMDRKSFNVNLRVLDDEINEELSILPDFKSAKELVYLLR